MKKIVWLLLDNRLGSVGQIRGVAQALDKDKFEIIEKILIYTSLSILPNWIKGSSLMGIDGVSRKELKEPYPDLVICASSRSISTAKYIKKKSKGETKLVYLMHPGNNELKNFNMVFMPRHDTAKKIEANCFVTEGSPHRVTKERLLEAKKEWKDKFAKLPKPLTALIIGGAIKDRDFSIENAKLLMEEVREFKHKIKGSLLMTTSRRTGKSQQEFIASGLSDIPSYNYLWGDNGDNPYLGFLACADNIIVTGDSVSMTCEVCGSGKPVFIFSGKKWLTPKHNRFVSNLIEKKYATELSTSNIDFKPEKVLNDAKYVAETIEKMFWF